jgi:hypothetical protein
MRTCRNTLASSYAKKRMVQLNWVRSAKYQVNAPGSPRGSLRSRTPAAFTLIADELYFGRSEARAEDLSTREARARASCDGTRVLGSVAGLPCGVTPVFVATIQRPPRRAIDWTRPAPGSPTETSTTPPAALQYRYSIDYLAHGPVGDFCGRLQTGRRRGGLDPASAAA